MRPSKHGDTAFLADILEACAHILSRVENVGLPRFADNRQLRDSINMQLVIIGEAAKHLSDKTRRRYPNIAWTDIARLRTLLVHRYWHADIIKLWEIVQTDIPLLCATLQGE
jgi:uncharacterized protein with HEPN domain